MSTNYLKNFAEGETIKASETNANNQFLLNKISDNASDIQLTVQSQISNVKSELATTKTALQKEMQDLTSQVQQVYINLSPDWSKKENKSIGTTYTANINGYLVGYCTTLSNATLSCTINNTVVYEQYIHGQAGGYRNASFFLPISKGDTYSASCGASTTFYFVPCKGDFKEQD